MNWQLLCTMITDRKNLSNLSKKEHSLGKLGQTVRGELDPDRHHIYSMGIGGTGWFVEVRSN